MSTRLRLAPRPSPRLGLLDTLVLAILALAGTGRASIADGDVGWERVGPPGGFTELTSAPSDPLRLYGGSGFNAFRSDDGGVSWDLLPAIRPDAVAVDPRDADHLYGLLEGPLRLTVSRNGGLSWQPAGELGGTFPPFERHEIVAAPSVGGGVMLAVATAGAIVRSFDEGESWQRLPRPGATNRLVADPTRPGTLYLTGPALFVSTDGGNRWRPFNRGLPAPGLRDAELSVGSQSGAFLLTGWFDPDDTARLYRTTSPGKAWRPASFPAWGPLLTPQEVRPGVWHAIVLKLFTEPILLGSSDGGVSWQRPLPRRTLPGVGLASAGDNLVLAGVDGMFHSADDGQTWLAANPTATGHLLNHVSFDPRGRQAIFAGEGPDDEARLRSGDGGATWSRVESLDRPWPGPRPIGPPQLLADGSRRLVSLVQGAFGPGYCGTAGIAVSSDRGVTWSLDTPFWGPARELAASPRSGLVCTIFEDGLFCGDCVIGRVRERGSPLECLTGAVFPPIPNPDVHPEARHAAFLADGQTFVLELFGQAEEPLSTWVATSDDGDHWQVVDPPTVEVLARGAVGSGIVYGLQAGAVVRSQDDGASWEATAPLPGATGPPKALALHPDTPSTVAAITEQGVFLSTDAAVTWTDFGAGLPPPALPLTAVGILTQPLPAVFVGASGGGGVFRRSLPTG
jgi:photosystem II stability/assembly factor-like uncharacterized protein